MKSRISLAVFIAGSILIIIASVLSGTGFFKKPIAVVEGERIEQETFKKALNMRIAAHKSRGVPVDDTMLKKAVLNELIADTLLLAEARKRGISVNDGEVNEVAADIKKGMPAGEFERQLNDSGISYDEFLKRLKNGMTIEKFERGLAGAEAVTEAEMKNFYDSGHRPVVKPARTKLKLIEVKTEAEARNIVGEMKDRAVSFDKMAEKLQKDNRAVVSFSGWVQLDVFSHQVAAAIAKIDKGGYDGPIQGKDGWYIIKVEDYETPKVATFEEAKEQLMAVIVEQKRRDVLARWVEGRRQSAVIKINEDVL